MCKIGGLETVKSILKKRLAFAGYNVTMDFLMNWIMKATALSEEVEVLKKDLALKEGEIVILSNKLKNEFSNVNDIHGYIREKAEKVITIEGWMEGKFQIISRKTVK